MRVLVFLFTFGMFALAGGFAWGGDITCMTGPFDTDIEGLRKKPLLATTALADREKSNLTIPIEIAQIRDGGYSFYAGGFGLDDGKETWYGFDLERRLYIAVLGGRGPQLKRLPAQEKMSKGQILRFTDAAGYRRAEFVTITEATLEQARDFSCLANLLLSTPIERTTTIRNRHAIKTEYVLVRGGTPLPSGGGPARWRVEDQLTKFVAAPLTVSITHTYGR